MLQSSRRSVISLHRRQRRRGCRGRDPPNIWPAGVVLCWQPPPIFSQVFYFSLQRNFWILQVAVIFICNAPSVQFFIQQLNRTAFNLLTGNFRFLTINSFSGTECTISHILRWKKIINFLGRGTAPLCLLATTVSPAKTDAPIEMLFGWARLARAQRTMYWTGAWAPNRKWHVKGHVYLTVLVMDVSSLCCCRTKPIARSRGVTPRRYRLSACRYHYCSNLF